MRHMEILAFFVLACLGIAVLCVVGAILLLPLVFALGGMNAVRDAFRNAAKGSPSA